MMLSLIIIILVHYLYIFFKTNLTVPKIKDLVNRPERKYKEIYQSLEKPDIAKPSVDMKVELKNYLKGLSTSDSVNALPTPAATSSTNFFNDNYESF
jgi:hypothetical protein